MLALKVMELLVFVIWLLIQVAFLASRKVGRSYEILDLIWMYSFAGAVYIALLASGNEDMVSRSWVKIEVAMLGIVGFGQILTLTILGIGRKFLGWPPSSSR